MRGLLRQYATSLKVSGSSPDKIEIFFSIGLILLVAPGPWGFLNLTEMSTEE
jgi:hypothetical protein